MPTSLMMAFTTTSASLRTMGNCLAGRFSKPKILYHELITLRTKKIGEIFAFGSYLHTIPKILLPVFLSQAGIPHLVRAARAGILKIRPLPKSFLDLNTIFMAQPLIYYFPTMKPKLPKWKHYLTNPLWQTTGCTPD